MALEDKHPLTPSLDQLHEEAQVVMERLIDIDLLLLQFIHILAHVNDFLQHDP